MSDCVICGEPAVGQWTINDGAQLAVADLCEEHGAPVREAHRLGSLPPSEREVLRPTKRRRTPEAPVRVPRKRRLEPLDWEPPTD